MWHPNRLFRFGLALAFVSPVLCGFPTYAQEISRVCGKPPDYGPSFMSRSEAWNACFKRENSRELEALKRKNELREKENAARDQTLVEKAIAAKEATLKAAKTAKQALHDPAGLVAGAINDRMGSAHPASAAGGKAQNPLSRVSSATIEKAVEKVYDKRGGDDVANSVAKTSTLASIRVMEHAAAEFDNAVSAAGQSSTSPSGWSYGTNSADKAAQAFSAAAADIGSRISHDEGKQIEYERALVEQRIRSAPLLRAHEEKLKEIRAQAEVSYVRSTRRSGKSTSAGSTVCNIGCRSEVGPSVSRPH